MRTLVENGIKLNHRSFIVMVGDRGRDQVVNLHYMLSKASVRARPSVLWCYKKDLGFSTHRKKRMRQARRPTQPAMRGHRSCCRRPQHPTQRLAHPSLVLTSRRSVSFRTAFHPTRSHRQHAASHRMAPHRTGAAPAHHHTNPPAASAPVTHHLPPLIHRLSYATNLR